MKNRERTRMDGVIFATACMLAGAVAGTLFAIFTK